MIKYILLLLFIIFSGIIIGLILKKIITSLPLNYPYNYLSTIRKIINKPDNTPNDIYGSNENGDGDVIGGKYILLENIAQVYDVDDNFKISDGMKELTEEIYIKYGEKNFKELSKIVNKKENKNKYIHLSKFHIDNVEPSKSFINPNNIYQNPQGLWVSIGGSWLDIVLSMIEQSGQPNQWSTATFIYEIIPNNNVLMIKNTKEFKKFIDDYKMPDKKIKIYNVIDWNKLKKKYSGLIINPYLADELLGKNAEAIYIKNYNNNKYPANIYFKALQEWYEKLLGKNWKKNYAALSEWYRHWDCASGVIWNNKGVKEIKLIEKLDTYKDLI